VQDIPHRREVERWRTQVLLHEGKHNCTLLTVHGTDRAIQYEAGEPGRRMMHGAFESDSVYSSYAPDNMPKPVGFGEFKDEPGSWFYVCEFHDMLDELPDVSELVDIVAKVHRASMGNSPTGKFGFDAPTHLANIPNDNSWQDTWEAFFKQLMQSMYEHEKLTQGPDEELDYLFDALCNKVIPSPV
jgi:protein-ribulosamine 3-kinase